MNKRDEILNLENYIALLEYRDCSNCDFALCVNCRVNEKIEFMKAKLKELKSE
jgi:hypothetical protein